MAATKDECREVIEAIFLERCINFHVLATQLGYDWYKDIAPKISSDPKLIQAMKESLEKLKCSLQDSLLKAALHGRQRENWTGDLPSLKAVIALIDSGELMRSVVKEDEQAKQEPVDMKKLLQEQGLLPPTAPKTSQVESQSTAPQEPSSDKGRALNK